MQNFDGLAARKRKRNRPKRGYKPGKPLGGATTILGMLRVEGRRQGGQQTNGARPAIIGRNQQERTAQDDLDSSVLRFLRVRGQWTRWRVWSTTRTFHDAARLAGVVMRNLNFSSADYLVSRSGRGQSAGVMVDMVDGEHDRAQFAVADRLRPGASASRVSLGRARARGSGPEVRGHGNGKKDWPR